MTRTMSDKEAELILATLQRGVKTYDQVVELLSYLPLHFGGIIPISNGLFHTLPIVRNSTLDLLCQIQQYDVGRQSLLTLNYFHRKAFIELLDRREASRAAQRVLAQQRVAEAEKSSSPPRADIPLPQQAMKVKAG